MGVTGKKKAKKAIKPASAEPTEEKLAEEELPPEADPTEAPSEEAREAPEPAEVAEEDAPKPAPARKKARPKKAPSAEEPPRGGTDIGTKVAATVSLAMVMIIAVFVNILAARHYKRWDFTKGGDFTLSDGTVDTLRALDEEIHIIVLVSRDTPIGVSLAEMLDGYGQFTNKIDIEFVDPDRDQPRLLELQKKYGLVAAESAGQIVTDAAMIVIQGDRHRYVQGNELVDIEDASDMRTRPRLEYAITSAIRHVRSASRPTICFSTGHDEMSLDVGGSSGMAELRDRLQKNNYEITPVFEDTADAPKDPLKTCQVLVVATPRATVPKEHADAMKRFIEDGGNAFIVVGPIPNQSQTDWIDLGLDDVLALAGVKLERDYVHELDPALLPRGSNGSTFFASVQVHPVSERLAREEQAGTAALLSFASSLTDLQGSVRPEPLLRSSPRSLGIVDYWERYGELEPMSKDKPGPLVLAVATERAPKPGQERGARMVVTSANNLLLGVNWADPSLRGNALLAEGAFSWLASHERFLDIPDKPLKTTGLRLTEEAMSSIFRYVVILIPTVVTLIGIAMYLVRRRRPDRPEEEPS